MCLLSFKNVYGRTNRCYSQSMYGYIKKNFISLISHKTTTFSTVYADSGLGGTWAGHGRRKQWPHEISRDCISE